MSTRLEHQSFRAMGTSCAAAVTAGPGDGARARRALAAAREEIAACERALSRFDEDSELSQLNRAAGSWVPAGPRLLAALQAALLAREETGGRYDPTVLPALTAAGYDRTFEQLRPRPPRPAIGWRAGARIEVDFGAGGAWIEDGSAVDLGGIGKGFSAERALDAMAEAWPELPGGLVDLGGDVAVRGAPPGAGPWRIDIVDPRRPGVNLGTLGLDRGGVATSGRDRRRFGVDRELHHLIDPATGAPAIAGPLTVTVVAPTATIAEAHATALALTAIVEARAYVEAQPTLSALLVPEVGAPMCIGDLPLLRLRIRLSVPA